MQYSRFVLSGGLALLLSAGGALATEGVVVIEGELPGTRIEVADLKRTSGDTVTLRFTLVNEGTAQFHVRDVFSHRDVRSVNLIDAAGRKKYLPLMDTANNCVCSGEPSRFLDPGASVNLWARFPAPPADVKQISVVIPGFIPADVPVTE